MVQLTILFIVCDCQLLSFSGSVNGPYHGHGHGKQGGRESLSLCHRHPS